MVGAGSFGDLLDGPQWEVVLKRIEVPTSSLAPDRTLPRGLRSEQKHKKSHEYSPYFPDSQKLSFCD